MAMGETKAKKKPCHCGKKHRNFIYCEKRPRPTTGEHIERCYGREPKKG